MKKTAIISLLLPVLILCSSCIHADTKVEFLPPAAKVTVTDDQNEKMKETVIKKFDLENPKSPFKSARIQVKYLSGSDTIAQVVLFYMAKYGAETYIVTFDKDYKVVNSVME